jgi:hypothetical protein
VSLINELFDQSSSHFLLNLADRPRLVNHLHSEAGKLLRKELVTYDRLFIRRFSYAYRICRGGP